MIVAELSESGEFASPTSAVAKRQVPTRVVEIDSGRCSGAVAGTPDSGMGKDASVRCD